MFKFQERQVARPLRVRENMTVEQRLDKLEKENAELKKEIAALKPEGDDEFFARIKEAGEADQAALPSAAAQIPSDAQVRQSREQQQFADYLEKIGGDLAEGYTFRQIALVAKHFDVSTPYAQQTLDAARRNLGK